MVKISIFLLSIVVLIATFYFLLGNAAVLISLGALFLSGVIILSIALGSWWTKRIMESGAQIALSAQSSDDRRDSVLIRQIGMLLGKGAEIGYGHSRSETSQYPQLPAPDAVEDIEFRIEGFDN